MTRSEGAEAQKSDAGFTIGIFSIVDPQDKDGGHGGQRHEHAIGARQRACHGLGPELHSISTMDWAQREKGAS